MNLNGLYFVSYTCFSCSKDSKVYYPQKQLVNIYHIFHFPLSLFFFLLHMCKKERKKTKWWWFYSFFFSLLSILYFIFYSFKNLIILLIDMIQFFFSSLLFRLLALLLLLFRARNETKRNEMKRNRSICSKSTSPTLDSNNLIGDIYIYIGLYINIYCSDDDA